MYQANDGRWYPVQQQGYPPQQQMTYGQGYRRNQGLGAGAGAGCCAGLCAGLLCLDCLECGACCGLDGPPIGGMIGGPTGSGPGFGGGARP
ncbi:hypothetical protein Q5752_004030 [Cryptotrichosporon argae]